MTEQPGRRRSHDRRTWRRQGHGVYGDRHRHLGFLAAPAGSQLAIDDRGAMVGSVSRRLRRGAVVARRRETIADGQPAPVDFGVTNEQAWEVGLACGGKLLQIYVERVE